MRPSFSRSLLALADFHFPLSTERLCPNDGQGQRGNSKSFRMAVTERYGQLSEWMKTMLAMVDKGMF